MYKELINSNEMAKMLDRMSYQAVENYPMDNLCIVGIYRRGVSLAKKLHELIKKHHNVELPFGTIDITLYRDDLSEISYFPEVHATSLDFDINGKTVLLVDDVIYTGRTVRAALECIVDYGRPAKIMLAVLIDRGHRELPIQPDIVGRIIPTSKNEIILVNVGDIDGKDNVEIREREI